jgi:hypothetical protein
MTIGSMKHRRERLRRDPIRSTQAAVDAVSKSIFLNYERS